METIEKKALAEYLLKLASYYAQMAEIGQATKMPEKEIDRYNAKAEVCRGIIEDLGKGLLDGSTSV